jgi:quinolinate synthase
MSTLDLFDEQSSKHQYLPEISEEQMSDAEVLLELDLLHKKLSDRVVVLGHHYQSDDIIRYADITGDSLALSQKAAKIKKPYVIFCGVHFMAETADIVADPGQQIILPDLNAGCSMADMASDEQIRKAWKYIGECTKAKIIPITYINCDARLKAFVGEHDGSICTSSNAKKVIQWAFSRGEKLMFFPDQHLGRNSCFELGIGLDEMVVYNPNMYRGGLSAQQIENAKVILWYGFCSVHQGFSLEQVENLKKQNPAMNIIVHPECNFEVVQAAHMNGSTSYIIDTIAKAPAGSQWAVGTEINLVNRLAREYSDKKIISLSPYQCLCTTMYRVRPRWLLASYRAIDRAQPINVVSVPAELKANARLALERMFAVS